LAPESKGNLADPEFRRARASKAGRASHSPDAEITRTLKRLARLTPEQIAASVNPPSPELFAQLRALLPEPAEDEP
jgi:hypothetical protein